MSRLFTFAMAAAAVLSTSTSLADTATSSPTQVGVTFSKVYTPVGFDSNDHVQFVGEGMFKNSCYRPAPTTVAVDAATKTIKVGPVAYEYSGFCLQVLLPFDRVVDVGILPAGTWQITQADNKKVDEIVVKSNLTSEPDDFLYAPVSQAYVRQSGSRTNLYLNGSFPNDCMTIQEVTISTTDDAIMVQPIAVMAKGACTGAPVSFTKLVKLPAIKAGRYLLHVRSVNGNAINSLVEIK